MKVQQQYTDLLVPCACKFVGNLEPWATLQAHHIQPLLDDMFGEGMYKAMENKAWYYVVHCP